MIEVISTSVEELGYSYKVMPSGAGHDAQNMEKGANVLLQSILRID